MKWKLDSVVDRHKESPYTFYLPSDHVLNQLKAGDLVKLMFMAEEALDNGYEGERMWVEILERNGSEFRGKLMNKPYYLQSLQYGDLIHFNRIHICDTQLDDPYAIDMNYYLDNKVTVSNDVLSRNEFNMMLRFEPCNDRDLGWVFFSGHEEDDFNADENNFQFISVGKILNIDDSILSFINDTVPCAYRRDRETAKFVRMENYDWSIHE
ncbi:MAG TPA: DUF2185 domain-containing protein [Bacillus sp. (in: firmicutes)]|uniref:immunity protein Imm33 domain-containing protein n=1 Tax=Paenibacillus ehimensis TaxID=79264 RepID=UPI002B543BD5|nr:DUF2185 domain-containing protein [Paenibacillus ehimensis]MEC0209781.1 DUF2185 domain-containing protein [Paenibacillus ehimensis]HWO78437.1 DUF2185 domain-containing protein [Bacillus sp. (in: firmicutes)]